MDYDKRLCLVENELGGVRKLIGVTKEYQDFTILVSAVDDLKKNHIDKQLFDEVIKRIEDVLMA